MRTSHRVARNTLVLYAKTGVTMFFSLYTTRVVLQELGAEGFGVFALVGSVIAMLGFLNGSMSAATQRFMSYAHGKGEVDEQKDIFNISFALHSIAGLLMVAILALIGPLLFAHVFKIDDAYLGAAKIIYYCVAAGVFFSVIAVPYVAVLTARENMPYIAVVSFTESLVKLGIAIGITFVAASEKLLTYGLLMAALPAFLWLLYALYCHWKYAECRFAFRYSHCKKLTQEMLGFSGWTFVSSFSSVVAQNSQGIVLNSFFGTSINAAQGITNQISGQLSVLAFSVHKAISPVVVKREGAGDRSGMLRITCTNIKASVFLKSIVFIPVAVELPYILSIWLTEVPDFAVIFCRIYLIKSLIDCYLQGIATAISSVGRIKGFRICDAIISFIPAISSVALFCLGYPPYVIYVVFAANSGLLTVVAGYFAKKHCNLKLQPFLNRVFLPLTLVVGMTLTATFTASTTLLSSSDWQRLLFVFVSSTLVLIVSTQAFALNKEEKKTTNELIYHLFTRIRRFSPL